MEKDQVWPLIGSDAGCTSAIKMELEELARINSNVSTLFGNRRIGNALQFFNGHIESYYRKKITDQDAQELINYMNSTQSRAFCHCPFSINLAKDPLEDDRSLKALLSDITAVGKAGVSAVCHIGHGLKNKFTVNHVCRTLSALDFWGVPGTYPLLLGDAAGDGTELGVSWDELGWLAQNTDPHVGFCIDTQHSFPGLKPDLTNPDGVNEFLKQIDRTIGLNRVKLFHLNDSKWNPKQPKGKKDCHAPFLQEGQIWGNDPKTLTGLNHLLLRGGELGIPFITETSPSCPYVIYDFLSKTNNPPGQ